MRKTLLYLAAGAFALSGAAMLGATGAMAESVSEKICTEGGGTWDKSLKKCTYPTVETKPGDNKGKAAWETDEADIAHGNLKNPKSTHEEECTGPGGSTSKC